jgi:hypothetical protein
MKDTIENLLVFCSEIDFGAVNLTEGENAFYKEFNNEVLLLCKSLPESTQADAVIHFMRYSGISFGGNLDFFKNYYVPTWSIIYWLIQTVSENRWLTQIEIKDAIKAHAMAMILHSLDDHLSDHEMPVTHLTLLIRSQSWMIMNNALNRLTVEFDEGKILVQNFIDSYYSGVCNSIKIETLDSYCKLFRKQMATGIIVPVLLAKKMNQDEKFAAAIQSAYGSFGIAWRLLDDIKDIEIDINKGIHSSIYACFSEEMKRLWDKDIAEKADENIANVRAILNHIPENKVIEGIEERICSELKSAASILDDYDMKGWTDELHCLLRPLKNRQDRL